MKQCKNPVLTAFLNLLSVKFKSLSFFNLKLKSLRRRRYNGVLIVSVDNLSFGGTGKTPLIIEIGKSLQAAGVKFAIVSRGYKAQYELAGVLVESFHSAAQVGDEAKLLKTRFPGVDVLIGRNRRRSVEKAIEWGNRVIILDDGFQSTDIYRDIKVMLFSPYQPYYYLRNFKFLMKEEDYIFYFVPGPAAQGLNKSFLRGNFPQSKVENWDRRTASPASGRFFKKAPLAAKRLIGWVRRTPAGGKNAVNRKPVTGTYYFVLENFYDSAGNIVEPGEAVLFGFSGIGDNRRFREDLSVFNLAGFWGYKDHYAFSEGDIRDLDNNRRQVGAQYLVCTEKDYIKIMDLDLSDVPLLYVRNVIKLDVDIAGVILEKLNPKH